MVARPHQAARRLRKANRKVHPPLSVVDRDRLRNRIFVVSCSDSWTDHATSQAERAGFTPTTSKLLARISECGIYPPPGDRVQMLRCDSCQHFFPPTYLVSVFSFHVCQDCAYRPAVTDHETHMVRDTRHTILMEILKHAHLKDSEIVALCRQWEGMSQRGIATVMNKSKTWVRDLLISANRKLSEAGIRLPDPPKASRKLPEVLYLEPRALERLPSR